MPSRDRSPAVEAAVTAASSAAAAGMGASVVMEAAQAAAVAAGASPSAAEAIGARAAAQAVGSEAVAAAVRAAAAVAVEAGEAAAKAAMAMALETAGTMVHVPVPSSNIETAAYNADTQEMEIRFTKYFRLYRYYGVPPEGWSAFWAAESKGRYARWKMPRSGGPGAVPGGLYDYEQVE